MGFQESGIAAVDRNFNLRVQSALVKIAIEIAGEPVDTPEHEARLRLALSVSQNPALLGARFAWLVAGTDPVKSSITVTDGVVTVGSDDNMIEALCEGFWTPIATWAR
jgi:hypothetical protein